MKYMGSKNRISKYLVPILEKEYYKSNCEIFIDACCGGCNLIDKISPIIPRYANDINKYLIAMWKGLQNGADFPKEIPKCLYNVARDVYNGKEVRFEHIMNMTDDMVGWIGFMGSYNGRFFDGGYSGHNVKVKDGKERDYITENINNIYQQLDSLRGVTFSNKSLFDIRPKKKSLIYFDIPYKDTKQYDVSKNFDYDRFYKFCEELKQDGHIIFISEYSMPDTFKCVWEMSLNTHMNQKTEKRVEKLFTL